MIDTGTNTKIRIQVAPLQDLIPTLMYSFEHHF